MTIKDIPVNIIGPGSQPEQSGDALLTIDMPTAMDSFVAPMLPEPEDIANMTGLRETMEWLQKALDEWRPDSGRLTANLSGLDAMNRELVNQVLGEGEVSVTYSGDVEARVQESVMAGVWRILYFDDQDRLAVDLVEVATVPHVFALASGQQARVNSKANGDGVIASNAMPILVELGAALERFEADGTGHSVNLTLLPLSEDAQEFIDSRLGRGPVHVLSRAYGKCEIISTGTANIWWIRHYNSMDKLILNLIEVGDVPAVVAAAPEDIADSAVRLGEILAPYWKDAP